MNTHFAFLSTNRGLISSLQQTMIRLGLSSASTNILRSKWAYKRSNVLPVKLELHKDSKILWQQHQEFNS